MKMVHTSFVQQRLLKQLNHADWIYALLILGFSGYSYVRYHYDMDGYEQIILAGVALGLIFFGWFWKSWRWFFPLSGCISLLSIQIYQQELERGQTVFLLKYILSSQSAIMWMCTLFFLATLTYWVGLLGRSDTSNRLGTGLSWAASVMGLAGLLTRWHESYLIGPDIGHIPVSNLYEVFVLFTLITALMYLYYESKYSARQMGALVLLIICSSVGFVLWYTFDRQAHEIQPLIPALQSWWMKIHVPANFVGYASFAIAAMLGIAELMELRGWLKGKLPPARVLDEVMYQAIAVGFLFFTIATILGAMWAADAWGDYWSWDPKETWALIVWLNYAAWLHIRLVKGWRGEVLAWWAVMGLLITSFAFLGVNMFLAGLHSYGGL